MEYKISLMKNAFYAQSGGVTSVINCSAYGLFNGFKKHFSNSNIFVGKNGIVGLIEDEIYDLSKTQKSLDLLLDSPGGMFGSCRYKLPDPESDSSFYEKIFKKFEDRNIGYFFYNGGNDSADTCLKIHQAAQILKFDLCAIAIPKTIDNDLAVTDNCPGFGSVAKYIAISAKEASLDIKSMCKTSTKVSILEVMGRHAGWIAAAGELANQNGSHVHKILLPEVPFDETKFLNGISNDVDKDGFSVVIASEGLKNSSGELYSASKEKDSFGHTQLGGLAPKLAELVNKNLNIKYHWSVSDYLQRSARHISSKTDVEQAIAVGEVAANMAADAKSGYMPIIKRLGNEPYKWEIDVGDLNEIANKEKVLPDNFISNCGFRITDEGISYLSPLIQGESYPKYKNGLPAYEQLDLHF